ncbi:MAG: hypothetical protein HYT62_03895 [Candidatus Yanofskybacteria bacterium]|nr:hypothetical protein [Candidatus Yanofskybacteria bacterium]
MREIHSELRKIFPWYNRWHKHPHHQHTHWFGLFSFLLLTSSFISAQTIFLYAERFEAQAQTGNLPAPNHPIYLGYYKVDANYGDFKDEVKNSVNMFMTETDYRLPVNQYKQNLDQDIQEMIALNKDIALGLDWGNDPIVDAALATATPYWNNIDFIMMTDEPSWDKLTTEQNIANLKSRISQRGLASKKILINFTPNQILTGTGYQASNLDIVSFEAYMNFDQQNSSTLASDLTNQIRQMKSAINNNKVGSKEKMIVVQGYARNYCPSAPTLCWTNLNSLKSLQSIPYLEAATDPSVIGLTIFSWSRATGTKDLSQNYNGDCIKREHERIWGAISGTTQPISIACGGGSGGPIQFAPILSQWSPPQTNNGWWPELSPDGRYVAYGNWGQSWVTDLQTKTNYDLSKPTGLPAGARCIAGKWIRSDTLTYVCDSIPGTSGFWRYEVKVGQWTPIKMNDDPLLVMGNRFEAKDGHWASYGAGRFQISKDNKVLVGGRADPNDTGALGGLDGSLLLSACTNNNNSLCVWDGYNLTDTLSIRTPGFNDFEIGGGDYIAYGNRTNLRGICMSDKQDINLKATSSSLSESVSGPVILVNGQPWLFTGAWNSSEGYMLLRPWGQRNSIVIDDLGVHMSIAYNNGVFTIAYNNDVGHLKVITVSENAPKNDLSGGLASETCGNTVSNSCPAPGITSRITTPSKTWNPKQNSGFGWFPHLSPDGRYVGYGFGNLRITDLKTSQERDFSKPFGGSTPSNYACYSPWWIKPTVATAQCVFDDYPPPILTDRIEIDTSDTSSWTARRTTDDPALVSGPGFTAYDGHWATGKVNGTIIYDNQVLISDPNIHWGAVTGQGGWLAFAINTVPPNIWEIWIYQNGNLVKKYQPKHGINSLSINNGYFAYADVKGHQTGVYPDGREVDLAATSWQGDFGGHIVMVQGQPWIVTAATDPSINKDIILLHEWGNTNSIIILGAASGLDTVFDPSTNEFIVAHNDAKGYLTVDWVPLNSQRYNLITDKFYCPVTTSPATTPISCEPGVVQPGIPVICGFSPTIARPGDSINVVGGNLSGTVELLSASGAKYTMTGTIDTAKSNIDFNIANNVPEGDYTLSIIGSDGITRATSNQVLRVVLVIPDAGATGTDIPFGQATGINVPGSTTTFEKIISDFLTYAVYGLGIAIFVYRTGSCYSFVLIHHSIHY